MTHWKRWAACVALASTLLAHPFGHAQVAPPAPARAELQPGGPLVDGAVADASLGEWTARWWRWARGQWVAPYLDPDGRLCDIGQDGPVWFLAGTDGTFNPQRQCVVPEGKHLLVPVINMIHWEPRGGAPCSRLQAGAAVNNDQLSSAVVLLNGEPLGDVRLHRVRSDGCFALDPADPQSRRAAADGYWLMLKPLPRGRHTLVVAANYGPTGDGYGSMVQNFEYVLHIGSEVLLGGL